jgi:hypothetical protein
MELEVVCSAAPSAEVYNECIRSHITLYGICVQSVTETVLSGYFGFPLSVSSSSALNSFTRLSPMPYSLNSRHRPWSLCLLSQVSSGM